MMVLKLLKFRRSCVWKTHSNKTNFTSVDRGKVDDNGDPFGVGFQSMSSSTFQKKTWQWNRTKENLINPTPGM